MTGVLRRETRDGVLWLTKDDTATNNGISLAMADALLDALGEAAGGDTRAVVIDAAGKGFHGGAAMLEEIKPSLADLGDADCERLILAGRALGRAIADLPIPVIGIARRGAAGGGMELLTRCDFLFCLDRAKFGVPEVTLGFVAAWGGVQWGGRQLPFRRAQEWLLTGEMIDGRMAADWGLVTRSFADMDALDAHVEALLAKLRRCSPAAFRWTKRLLAATWEGSPADCEEIEMEAERETMRSRDFVEGFAAMRRGEAYDFVAGRPVPLA